MQTRVGGISYRRWVHQNEYGWVGSVAPLDHRLGLIGADWGPRQSWRRIRTWAIGR